MMQTRMANNIVTTKKQTGSGKCFVVKAMERYLEVQLEQVNFALLSYCIIYL